MKLQYSCQISSVKVDHLLVDAWCMILIDEAVEEYADSVGRFGARPKLNRQPGHVAALIDEIDQRLPGDLRIPGDLRDFWTDWNPSTFGMFLGDGLPTVERSVAEWQGSELPSILMLACSMGHQALYIELQSDLHPGTRLYFSDPGDQVLRLWGLGIVDLLNLVGAAYGETNGDPEGPYSSWVETETLHRLAAGLSVGIGASQADHRIDLARPMSWPSHWQLANDITACRETGRGH